MDTNIDIFTRTQHKNTLHFAFIIRNKTHFSFFSSSFMLMFTLELAGNNFIRLGSVLAKPGVTTTYITD